MRAPERSEILIYAACALAVAYFGLRELRKEPAQAVSTPVAVSTSAGGAGGRGAVKSVVVHVVGEVQRPAVYSLREGQRVRDAVRKAGGLTAGADPAAVNLAAKVVDGQQVVIPVRSPAGGTTGGAASAAGAPISLSQATADELDELDGVGPATAEKIVAYRDEHGGFQSVDELEQVPGIGPKKLESLRGQLQP